MKSLQTNKREQKPEKLVLTGYRMLKILKLLIVNPKNTDEINEAFKLDLNIQKSISNDMICLYINTLRQIGCDISRPSKSNDFKYVLNSHPFEFKISQQESQTLYTIVKNLLNTNDWEFVIDICELFKEIQQICSRNSKLDFLSAISNILKIDITLVKKLDFYCKNEKLLNLEYASTSSEVKKITIIANKLFMENSKLYLWGYNEDIQEMQYLRVDRIKDIKLISLKDMKIKQNKQQNVTYKLLGNLAQNFKPNENQTIISQTTDEIIVQEKVINKFKFIQNILLKADECVIIKPTKIKEEVIASLKEILSTYE